MLIKSYAYGIYLFGAVRWIGRIEIGIVRRMGNTSIQICSLPYMFGQNISHARIFQKGYQKIASPVLRPPAKLPTRFEIEGGRLAKYLTTWKHTYYPESCQGTGKVCNNMETYLLSWILSGLRNRKRLEECGYWTVKTGRLASISEGERTFEARSGTTTNWGKRKAWPQAEASILSSIRRLGSHYLFSNYGARISDL